MDRGPETTCTQVSPHQLSRKGGSCDAVASGEATLIQWFSCFFLFGSLAAKSFVD